MLMTSLKNMLKIDYQNQTKYFITLYKSIWMKKNPWQDIRWKVYKSVIKMWKQNENTCVLMNNIESFIFNIIFKRETQAQMSPWFHLSGWWFLDVIGLEKHHSMCHKWKLPENHTTCWHTPLKEIWVDRIVHRWLSLHEQGFEYTRIVHTKLCALSQKA